jgi:hypothetical protein
MHQLEFREQSELFIMTALYHLGTGGLFCTCQALCNISISEACKFFPFFLHAMHEMQGEYILLPTNITQLRRITKYYKEACWRGCCESMDVVHVKWSSCPKDDHTHAKVKCGYPSLGFQCITNFNCRICAIYAPQFVQETTRRSSRMIPTFITLERVGIRMFFGGITLQRAESNRIEMCM